MLPRGLNRKMPLLSCRMSLMIITSKMKENEMNSRTLRSENEHTRTNERTKTLMSESISHYLTKSPTQFFLFKV